MPEAGAVACEFGVAGALAGLVCAFWADWTRNSRVTRATRTSVQVQALQIVVMFLFTTSAEEGGL